MPQLRRSEHWPSLVMPFNAGEISTGAIVSLLLMHVIVGAVLIPWYARTIR